MNYQGSCHCGRVAFEVEGTIDSGLSCNCSMCGRKGSLLWFVPREQMKLNDTRGCGEHLHVQQPRDQAPLLPSVRHPSVRRGHRPEGQSPSPRSTCVAWRASTWPPSRCTSTTASPSRAAPRSTAPVVRRGDRGGSAPATTVAALASSQASHQGQRSPGWPGHRVAAPGWRRAVRRPAAMWHRAWRRHAGRARPRRVRARRMTATARLSAAGASRLPRPEARRSALSAVAGSRSSVTPSPPASVTCAPARNAAQRDALVLAGFAFDHQSLPASARGRAWPGPGSRSLPCRSSRPASTRR